MGSLETNPAEEPCADRAPLKRYDIAVSCDWETSKCSLNWTEHQEGDWVLYADVCAEREAQEAELEQYRKQIHGGEDCPGETECVICRGEAATCIAAHNEARAELDGLVADQRAELERLRESLTFIAEYADGEKAVDLALDPQLAVRVAQDALAGVEPQPPEASEGQEGGDGN